MRFPITLRDCSSFSMVALLFIPGLAHSLPAFAGTFTSFDISRGTQPSAMAINSSGTIAVYYFGTDNAYHGFLRTLAGGLTTINAPGAGWKNFGGTYALSINDAGQVAGFYVDNGGTEHGFYRDALGNYSTYDPPGSVNTLGLMLNQAGE